MGGKWKHMIAKTKNLGYNWSDLNNLAGETHMCAVIFPDYLFAFLDRLISNSFIAADFE